MNNNTVSEFFKSRIDDSIPSWQELGTQAFFTFLIGALLTIAVCAAVVKL